MPTLMSSPQALETAAGPWEGGRFPPSELWSDEPPSESDWHREQIELLLSCLKGWRRDRRLSGVKWGRQVNQAGLDLVKEFEGLARRLGNGRVAAYLDAVGVPTIGYGHTANVYLGQIITAEQAENFLSFRVGSSLVGKDSWVWSDVGPLSRNCS